jgi:hypothetical protein
VEEFVPKKVTQESISRFGEAIMLVHIMAAQSIRLDSLVLSKKRAEELSAALQNVGRWYGTTTVLSEKSWDWINLVIVAGATYGPVYSEFSAKVHAAKVARAAASAPMTQTVNSAGGFDRPNIEPEVE